MSYINQKLTSEELDFSSLFFDITGPIPNYPSSIEPAAVPTYSHAFTTKLYPLQPPTAALSSLSSSSSCSPLHISPYTESSLSPAASYVADLWNEEALSSGFGTPELLMGDLALPSDYDLFASTHQSSNWEPDDVSNCIPSAPAAISPSVLFSSTFLPPLPPLPVPFTTSALVVDNEETVEENIAIEAEDEDDEEEYVEQKKSKRVTSTRAIKKLKAPSPVKGVGEVKDNFTGTRNTKIQPIDFNAPTMSRSYVLPSSTSRKRAPSVTALPAPKKPTKSRRSTAIPAEPPALFLSDVDLDSLDPSLDLTAIELKRRSNTLAARKSRMRKSGHLNALQSELEEMRRERDEWKAKAEELEKVVAKLRRC